jgi:4-hydroxybenzoate polyprenyltransferase
VWTNVLAALVVSSAGFSGSNFFLLSLSMSLFYSGGMCLNDLFDLENDRIKKPFRPLPSGRLSIGQAYGFTVILFGSALVLLLAATCRESFYAGLILLLFIVLYDRVHKRHPSSVFLMAGCRWLVFITSGIAATGRVEFLVVLAGGIQFVYILVLCLIARYENRLEKGYSFPVIPWMLAGISLLDGLVMAWLASPSWILAGGAGMILTRFGQRYVKGD